MKALVGDNGKRGFFVRAFSGILVLLFAFFLVSIFYVYIIKPILNVWEPVFVYVFGDIRNEHGSFLLKFFGFLFFSCSATLMLGVVVDAVVSSSRFHFVSRLLYKIKFVRQVLSFFQSGANAYRNLKRARSVLLRMNGVEVPAFITKERQFFVKGKHQSYFVLYCPHTPTFVTGNTLYVLKDRLTDDGIIDVARGTVIEDVLSAGIFGVHDEPRQGGGASA